MRCPVLLRGFNVNTVVPFCKRYTGTRNEIFAVAAGACLFWDHVRLRIFLRCTARIARAQTGDTEAGDTSRRWLLSATHGALVPARKYFLCRWRNQQSSRNYNGLGRALVPLLPSLPSHESLRRSVRATHLFIYFGNLSRHSDI